MGGDLGHDSMGLRQPRTASYRQLWPAACRGQLEVIVARRGKQISRKPPVLNLFRLFFQALRAPHAGV